VCLSLKVLLLALEVYSFSFFSSLKQNVDFDNVLVYNKKQKLTLSFDDIDVNENSFGDGWIEIL
jgi:hypothetical protein